MNNSTEITYIGKTDFRNAMTRFGIKAIDRTKHMYIIGKTGTGKSTFLENLIVQDIINGNGIAFIDPHGGSAEKMLEFIPEYRIKDVIYLNPSDTDFPIAFNPLEDVDPAQRPLVVDGLMTVFKKIWPDAFSGRMEYILNNSMLALLEYPDPTLLSINRFLTDKDFRKRVINNVSDPTVKNAWDELSRWDDKRWSEATGALINKVGQFTTNPLIRNIVGQVKSTFDFRKAMDERKILIINLSKGRIGEQNQPLFGAMLITKIYLAAMSRADLTVEEKERAAPFYFYVDEFQNFANDSFANILSEARKYGLCLTVANQYVDQMAETIRNAVFGNMGTTIAFRVGPLDSPLLEKVFSPTFTANDLENLQFGQFYLTLQIDGMGSRPFSAQSLWPIPAEKQFLQRQVIETSRSIYARPRADVEREIIEWFGYNNKKIDIKEKDNQELKQSPIGVSKKNSIEKVNNQNNQKIAPKKEKNQTNQKPLTKKHVLSEIDSVYSTNQSIRKNQKRIEEKITPTNVSVPLENLLKQFEEVVVIDQKNATPQSQDEAISFENSLEEKPTNYIPHSYKDKSAKTDSKNALREALQKAEQSRAKEQLKTLAKNESTETLSDILEHVKDIQSNQVDNQLLNQSDILTHTQNQDISNTPSPSKIVREVPEDILKKIFE